jgi:hypothetical protein
MVAVQGPDFWPTPHTYIPIVLGDRIKEVEVGPICSTLGTKLPNSVSEEETVWEIRIR